MREKERPVSLADWRSCNVMAGWDGYLKYDRPLAIHPHCTINARYGKCNHANHSSIRTFHRGNKCWRRWWGGHVKNDVGRGWKTTWKKTGGARWLFSTFPPLSRLISVFVLARLSAARLLLFKDVMDHGWHVMAPGERWQWGLLGALLSLLLCFSSSATLP